MLVAPVLSARTIPAMVRAAVAVLLTGLLIAVTPMVAEGFALGPGALASEMVVGLGIGFGAAVLLAGAELAGDVLAVQTGLSGANTLDPLTGMGTAVLGQLLSLFVMVLFLVTGGHLVLLDALAQSFQVIPAGVGIDVTAGAWEIGQIFGLLFVQGLRFAAPIIAAVSIGYVALGVLARTSPQLNMLAVAFPLQIGLGFFMLAGALPLAATFYANWPEHVSGLAERFIVSLVGG